MDNLMNDMSTLGGPGGLHEHKIEDDLSLQKITQLEPGSLKSRIRINKGVSSGLADKTSKLSSQERLISQARLAGKSAMVTLAAINIALFTPIEFSFGKMTAISLNAMMFCLDKIKEEDRKGEALKNKKSNKYASLKRLESSAKKFGAMVGFTAMALLMGGFGSIAVGSAFTIQNSLTMQEE